MSECTSPKHVKVLACLFIMTTLSLKKLKEANPASYSLYAALSKKSGLPPGVSGLCISKHSTRMHAQVPKPLDDMTHRYVDVVIPCALDGINFQGCPCDTYSFALYQMEECQSSILCKVPIPSQIDGRRGHFRLLRLNLACLMCCEVLHMIELFRLP